MTFRIPKINRPKCRFCKFMLNGTGCTNSDSPYFNVYISPNDVCDNFVATRTAQLAYGVSRYHEGEE